MEQARKGKPPRLERIFQSVGAPVFFVTFNTHGRQPFLADPVVHSAFREYCARAGDHHVAVGKYVLMPDHVHLFVCFGAGSEVSLCGWIKGLKRHLDKCLGSLGEKPFFVRGQKLRSYWQPGFFDHLLRSDESYAQKWGYLPDNPVRAGLVGNAADWAYTGEIIRIDRV